jgi:hypothetical protein
VKQSQNPQAGLLRSGRLTPVDRDWINASIDPIVFY